MFIYLIVNHVTGKYYVGQHKGTNLRQYLQKKFYEADKRLGGQSRLYASMRKHPREAWSIHALLSDVQTREELNQKERDFIVFLRSRDPAFGYNICRGGEGFSGRHSQETRAKIAASSREMWQRSDIKLTISAKNRGRKRSGVALENVRQAASKRVGIKAAPAAIQKLVESHTGLTRSLESREKQRCSVLGVANHFYGKTHTEASRRKIRDRLLLAGVRPPPGSFKGRKHTEQTKQKMRESALRRGAGAHSSTFTPLVGGIAA